ncbi:MAG: HpaII family restriction endonuclease [Flavobacterium sp.]|nr:MAG: HpaII family restriction endonuclease [Flavobacterium sp.]
MSQRTISVIFYICVMMIADANTHLLNASSTTNFTFKIIGTGLTTTEVNQINAINNSRKIRARIQAIYAKGNILELSQFDNQVFKNNLVLIDSLMPKILANALLYFYKDEVVNMADICKALTSSNPVKYDQSLNHNFYEHKLKRFLSEVALGMMPNTIWTGVYAGTEGYVIVKKDGEVVCYHIINRNLFEDYLLENTKLETPSSTRHRFGEIYDVKGELRIKLNLQIRFI